MPALNRVMLIGNLTKDPEMRYTTNGTAVCTFGVATNETRGSGENKKEDTQFHNIVCWSKLAEIVEKYAKKGQLVYVEGRLTDRSWDDRDGNKRHRTEVVANTVTFLSRSDSQ